MKKRAFFFFCFQLLMPLSGQAQLPSGAESLEVAFIYNFTHFVEWPTPIQKQFIVCIVGTNSLGEGLASLEQKTVSDVPIKIDYDVNYKNASHCNIAFISKNNSNSLTSLLSNLKTKPVLTVSDIPGFAKYGGDIELIEINDKINFHINRSVIQQQNLTISAKLLELAQEVY